MINTLASVMKQNNDSSPVEKRLITPHKQEAQWMAVEDIDEWLEAEIPFCLWTKGFIYFMGVYDGECWVESLPRHPQMFDVHGIGGS